MTKEKTAVTRFTSTPAIYGFDVLTYITEEEARKRSYPENIARWGWHSMPELIASVDAFYRRCLTGRYMSLEEAVLEAYRFDPVNFTKLNQQLADNSRSQLKDSFTWFLNVGEGHLFLDRPGSSCPFNDPELYVPAQWGLNMLKAVRHGFMRIEIEEENLKGILPGGGKASALFILA